MLREGIGDFTLVLSFSLLFANKMQWFSWRPLSTTKLLKKVFTEGVAFRLLGSKTIITPKNFYHFDENKVAKYVFQIETRHQIPQHQKMYMLHIKLS